LARLRLFGWNVRLDIPASRRKRRPLRAGNVIEYTGRSLVRTKAARLREPSALGPP